MTSQPALRKFVANISNLPLLLPFLAFQLNVPVLVLCCVMPYEGYSLDPSMRRFTVLVGMLQKGYLWHHSVSSVRHGALEELTPVVVRVDIDERLPIHAEFGIVGQPFFH